MSAITISIEALELSLKGILESIGLGARDAAPLSNLIPFLSPIIKFPVEPQTTGKVNIINQNVKTTIAYLKAHMNDLPTMTPIDTLTQELFPKISVDFINSFNEAENIWSKMLDDWIAVFKNSAGVYVDNGFKSLIEEAIDGDPFNASNNQIFTTYQSTIGTYRGNVISNAFTASIQATDALNNDRGKKKFISLINLLQDYNIISNVKTLDIYINSLGRTIIAIDPKVNVGNTINIAAMVSKLAGVLNNINDLINQYNLISKYVATTTLPNTQTRLPRELPSSVVTTMPTIDLEALANGTFVEAQILAQSTSMSISRVRTETEEGKRNFCSIFQRAVDTAKAKAYIAVVGNTVRNRIFAKRKWRCAVLIPNGKKKKNEKDVISITANVETRSAWISQVTFKFNTPKSINSNKRGTITFLLKSGKSFNAGVYKRGIFSHIVVLLSGTGYGYWADVNRKALVDPTTISYNMPKINNGIMLESIEREQQLPNIKYL